MLLGCFATAEEAALVNARCAGMEDDEKLQFVTEHMKTKPPMSAEAALEDAQVEELKLARSDATCTQTGFKNVYVDKAYAQEQIIRQLQAGQGQTAAHPAHAAAKPTADVLVWCITGEERIGQGDEILAINEGVQEGNANVASEYSFSLKSIRSLEDAEVYSQAVKSGEKSEPALLILICHSCEDGGEFDFVSYSVTAAKVAELFAGSHTHLVANSCFSESLVAHQDGQWKSIFAHKISLAPTDAMAVSKACLNELIKPGVGNVAVAARTQLQTQGYLFQKTCSHANCQCKANGKAWVPAISVADACNARKRPREENSDEETAIA